MFFHTNLNLTKEKDKISKEILKCCLSGKKRLDVISVFYSACDIFLEVIRTYINEKKDVLYITNEDEDSIDIIYFIKKYSNLYEYEHSDEINMIVNKYLHVCNHEDASKLQKNFDLVIYNDIRSFPRYNKKQIKKVLLKMCKDQGMAIAYSVENIFNEGAAITIPLRDNKIPIIEPRIITTRVNLNIDIPLVVYNYLKWSIISNRRVIIFTPDEKKATAVFKYLYGFKEKLTENILLYISNKSDAHIPIQFMNKDKGIIVTNDFEESYLEFHAVDVIVYFADDIKFNYKQLLYLSSKVGRNEEVQRGEAIFLANVETYEMDKARSIAREFNEKAWERGLLSI